MNTHHHQQPHTADTRAAQAASLPAYQQIKLALDVHAATIVVVRMLDGAKPQPRTVTTELTRPHGRKFLLEGPRIDAAARGVNGTVPAG